MKSFLQSESKSCKANVISIDTPPKTICSMESGMAGLILPDSVIKKYGGSLSDVNENFQLQYGVNIEQKM